MVLLVGDALPAGASGAVADTVAERGGGLAAFDMAAAGGRRATSARARWVEQVGTRLPQLPMVGIAPTFAEPELVPYLRTGQLEALLATVRDDAAYVESVAGTNGRARDDRSGSPSAAAMLLGMLVALAVLGQGAGRRAAALARCRAAARGRGRRGMSGFFDEGLAGVVATWIAALVTIGVWAYLVGRAPLLPPRPAPAGRPGNRLPDRARGARGAHAAPARTARPATRVASSCCGRRWCWCWPWRAHAGWHDRWWRSRPPSWLAGVAAFALGGAVVGTLLPQMAGALLPPGTGRQCREWADRPGHHRAGAGRLPAWRAARPVDGRGGRRPAAGCCWAGSVAGSGFLLVSRLALLVDRLAVPPGRLAGDRPMTVDEQLSGERRHADWRRDVAAGRRGIGLDQGGGGGA